MHETQALQVQGRTPPTQVAESRAKKRFLPETALGGAGAPIQRFILVRGSQYMSPVGSAGSHFQSFRSTAMRHAVTDGFGGKRASTPRGSRAVASPCACGYGRWSCHDRPALTARRLRGASRTSRRITRCRAFDPRQRRMCWALGLPEVGVQFSVEAPGITSVRLATQQMYPHSYPHGRGGTLLTPPPEQRVLNLGCA
jgi:hypothetical protein